ncbi:MAG: hypothetical protein WBM84_20420, partial [Sedimenticolaceae bacterium]
CPVMRKVAQGCISHRFSSRGRLRLPGDIQPLPGNHAAAERVTNTASTPKIRLLFVRRIICKVVESVFSVEGVKYGISLY